MTNYACGLEYCPQGVQILHERENKPVVRLVYQDADSMALLDFSTVYMKMMRVFRSKDLSWFRNLLR